MVLQLDEPGDAPASSRFRAGGICKVVEASRRHGRWPCRKTRAIGIRTDGTAPHGPRPSGKQELGVFSPPSTNWQNVAKDDNLAESTGELKRGLHRYCSGCAQETEHVLCQSDDGPSIPAIRWPAAKAASGTTMCVDCGAVARRGVETDRSGLVVLAPPAGREGAKPDSPTPVQDGPLESAAENEGMPPLRAPTRLRPGQPARTMKNPIATY